MKDRRDIECVGNGSGQRKVGIEIVGSGRTVGSRQCFGGRMTPGCCQVGGLGGVICIGLVTDEDLETRHRKISRGGVGGGGHE